MTHIKLRNVTFNRKLEVDKHQKTSGDSALRKRHRDVIQNVTISIFDGERVGLLGPNGSGKTTLLRLMAGIFRPDKGSVVREGEVSTFLDGGFGLDPQLTGRSNCESRAIMARMRGVRAKGMVKWVEEFSELGDYFDQPVRTYSTGMIMRLVFAIGTAQTHQILLIDEGFATADAHFQTKALERLREMYNNAPIMVLASHSIDLLKQHCQRGIVIIDGQVAFDGTLESASEFYSQHPRGNQPHTA